MPVTVNDEDTDYDAPQSRGAKIIEQFRDQVCSSFSVRSVSSPELQVKRGSPIVLSVQSIVRVLNSISFASVAHLFFKIVRVLF